MTATSHVHQPLPIRHVSLTQPLSWLKRGWDDLSENPIASLAYGLLVSGLGVVILGLSRHPYYVAAAISGFLLVGPIMTAGLCELSRCRDRGQPVNFDFSLHALKRSRTGLARFANLLLLFGAIWCLASTMILTILLPDATPGLAQTVWGDVMRTLSTGQLLSYAFAGGVLAAVVFVVSVVSVPLIIDRNVSALEAVQTSLRVSLADLPAMVVWGVLIVGLVAIGFASFLVAMVVVFPLLGHATWHAYRDLVE